MVPATWQQKDFLDLNNILCQKLNTSHYNVVTGSIILELAYQKDHLSLIISACPVRNGREGMLKVPSDGKLHMAAPRRGPWLPCHIHLVESSPSSISSIPLNILQVSQQLIMLSGLDVPGNGYFCDSFVSAINIISCFVRLFLRLFFNCDFMYLFF